jgi:hypothetical protein
VTENNKPEWIAMAEADGKPEIRKASKSLPVSALIVVALILGVGAVIGETQNETPSAGITTTVATPKLSNPSIAQLPTGRDVEDDEDEGHHGRGHHHDDDEGDDD